jgi:uncharacterized protein
MALRFEQSFAVKAPPERVWAFLTDPRRAATALPGAAVTEQIDDQTYAGTITVKVGPVSARYRGTVRFEKLDPATRTAEIVAAGQDTSGRGGADMRMTSRLVEKAPGETEVSVVSEVNVTGMLAQFGRGMIQDVSDQMLQKFTTALRAELEGAPAAEASPAPGPLVPAPPPPVSQPPIQAVSLGTQVLGRALRRQAIWIVLAIVIAILVWLALR